MAYTQAYAGKKGTRHRGFYQDSDGRYRSAGTYDTAERALEVAEEAEKHAAKLIRQSHKAVKTTINRFMATSIPNCQLYIDIPSSLPSLVKKVAPQSRMF